MYIKRIVNENTGPIENIDISLPFNEDKTPKPVIIVGENGSGKSIFLSNIVDAFYEIAAKAFDNVVTYTNKGGHEYYKIITTNQITVGKKYMYSYINFFNDEKNIDYILKSGDIETTELKEKIKSNINLQNFSNKVNKNYKNIDIDSEISEKIFDENVICFFSPNRYEKPSWLGENYHNYEHFSIENRFRGKLDKPITIKNSIGLNLQWLMDIIADSRCDIEEKEKKLEVVHVLIQDLLALGVARKNVEKIMSEILGKEIYFGLNFRNSGASRFNIKSTKDNSIVVPTLDSLSTGQLALFNIFSTIIRYSERTSLQNSIELDRITGIVVIDEIELHLHTILQREILPKLIKLFPKVQFIITTHSPLFLLGMNEVFGENNYEVYQMPTGLKIDIEYFSEFQRAYNYFKETQKYQTEIKEAIDSNNIGRTLIITEGATDWRHMKAAYNKLSSEGKIPTLDFEFLEYDPINSDSENNLKLAMSCSQLSQMCDSYSKMKQNRKMIFIADVDDSATTKKLSDTNNLFKDWGNNVYSLILPVPSHRETTPDICIEHYYKDEEIKTKVDFKGKPRRLYMANEFNKHGHNFSENIFCEKKIDYCGKDKIKIIEGSSGEKVFSFDDENTNLALPKMIFAKKIYECSPEFQNIKFDSFIKLFNVIEEILKLPLKS